MSSENFSDFDFEAEFNKITEQIGDTSIEASVDISAEERTILIQEFTASYLEAKEFPNTTLLAELTPTEKREYCAALALYVREQGYQTGVVRTILKLVGVPEAGMQTIINESKTLMVVQIARQHGIDFSTVKKNRAAVISSFLKGETTKTTKKSSTNLPILLNVCDSAIAQAGKIQIVRLHGDPNKWDQDTQEKFAGFVKVTNKANAEWKRVSAIVNEEVSKLFGSGRGRKANWNIELNPMIALASEFPAPVES